MVLIWPGGSVLKYDEGILDVVLFLGFMLDKIDCGLVCNLSWCIGKWLVWEKSCLFSVVIFPSFCSYSRHQELDSSSNWLAMENIDKDVNQEVDMEDSEFMECQRLVIMVSALNSTISFSLDTLVQHRVMVGQLQDEVDFLRTQVESLKPQLAQQEEDHGNSPSGGGNGGSTALEASQLLDLNAPTNPFEVDDKIDKEICQALDSNA
jgi:hypothetical protein